MKPLFYYPPSSIVLCFSIALFVISSDNISTCMCQDDSQYTTCKNAFACGSSAVSNMLNYPFWGGNREPYCGDDAPELELKCEDGVPKITINLIKYRILDWSNTTQQLTVARDDYWDGICAVTDDYKNGSFDNTPFQRDASDFDNVTLLYNCASTPNTPNVFHCDDGRHDVYYVLEPSSSFPCTSVVIPILGTQASALASGNGNINDTLKEGFELSWSGDSTECHTCVDSGGACGNDGGSGFRCFCKDGPHTTSCNSQRAPTSNSSSERNWKLIVGASVAGFGVTIFFIVISCYLKRGIGGQKSIFKKRSKFVDHNVEAFMRSYNLSMPKRYNYAEVKRITNSFQDKLGQGGYGVVYKASLPDGRHVAVKVISESKGNGEEFINEVASISKTSHVNIVSLLGFCYEMNKRALMYEFMPNGSLDKFIYKSGFPTAICNLDWNTLFQIAIGIARGLEYLHHGCTSRILHLDIKRQNILLDEDFCP